MSDLNFVEDVWIVTFYHTDKGGVWADTLNATDERDAISKARHKFTTEGLNIGRVYRVETQVFRKTPEA